MTVNIEELLDDAESSAGFTPVAPGTYKLRVLSAKTKIIEHNGIRKLGIALAPIADGEGNSINGESIYHTLPLEGEFKQTQKDGSTATKSLALFFMTFFRKGLGLERDDVAAIYNSALEAEVGSDAQLQYSNGEIFDVSNKELMGKVAVTSKDGTEYRNVKSVWAVDEA